MADIEGLRSDPRFQSLPPERQQALLQRLTASAPSGVPRGGSSLGDVMAWRQQTMGDLGRREPQTSAEKGAAAAGAGVGLTVATTAATAPMSVPALGSSAAGLTASLLVGDYVEKKLGLPRWMGEAFAIAMSRNPRTAAGKLFKGWLGRAEKGAAKAGADKVKKAITKEVVKDITEAASEAALSPTVGTTSKTSVPPGGLPARATPSRIPKAPKRPGIVRMMGGGKADIAWRESQGLSPGSMGPDDVLAMKARGATQEEIEAALLRAARPSRPWGHPTPKVGEKPANWKPSGAAKPKDAPAAGPKIQGGTAGEATPLQIVKSIRQWSGTNKLSKPQIENALREVYGIPKKEAREIILMVL